MMTEYFKRASLIKAICKIGDDSKGSWSTSSIVDFLLNQPVANVEEEGVKRLTIRARVRAGEEWTPDMAKQANIKARQEMFGSQW